MLLQSYIKYENFVEMPNNFTPNLSFETTSLYNILQLVSSCVANSWKNIDKSYGFDLVLYKLLLLIRNSLGNFWKS